MALTEHMMTTLVQISAMHMHNEYTGHSTPDKSGVVTASEF